MTFEEWWRETYWPESYKRGCASSWFAAKSDSAKEIEELKRQLKELQEKYDDLFCLYDVITHPSKEDNQ